MALFFLGAGPLIALLDRLLKISAPWRRNTALALLLLLFLFDNAAWLGKNAFHSDELLSLSQAQSATLGWLRGNLKAGDMVVCRDQLISYLVSTYTPARSWQGHNKITPDLPRRHGDVERFFGEGYVQEAWKRPGVFYVTPAAWLPPPGLALRRRYENNDFAIWSLAT
jgi:hypothetical protein